MARFPLPDPDVRARYIYAASPAQGAKEMAAPGGGGPGRGV